MRWRRWYPLLGLMVLTTMANDCGGGGGKAQDEDLRKYVGPNGRLYKWQNDVSVAVCQLEEKNPENLEKPKRLCPEGPGGPGDKSTAPSYPPAQ